MRDIPELTSAGSWFVEERHSQQLVLVEDGDTRQHALILRALSCLRDGARLGILVGVSCHILMADVEKALKHYGVPYSRRGSMFDLKLLGHLEVINFKQMDKTTGRVYDFIGFECDQLDLTLGTEFWRASLTRLRDNKSRIFAVTVSESMQPELSSFSRDWLLKYFDRNRSILRSPQCPVNLPDGHDLSPEVPLSQFAR